MFNFTFALGSLFCDISTVIYEVLVSMQMLGCAQIPDMVTDVKGQCEDPAPEGTT